MVNGGNMNEGFARDTRAGICYGAAVGAILHLEPDAADAAQWISAGMPRAASDDMACAALLVTALDVTPGMSAEALYLTAALAYGGPSRGGAFAGLPAARRMAFAVFAAVAGILPRLTPPPADMMEDTLRKVRHRPRGLGLHPDLAAALSAPAAPAKPLRKR